MGRGDDAANRCPAHQLRQIHHIRVGESAISTSANPPRSPVTVARGGNELCVIEPGNNYLAGTGYLGEVTFDGTLDVGLFWRDALGWPLVWDKDEQTADPSAAPRSHGTHGADQRANARTEGTGSAST
jgi:hypothetical protein